MGYVGMEELVKEIDKTLYNPVWEQARRAEAGDEAILIRHGHAAVRPVPIKATPDCRSRKATVSPMKPRKKKTGP